MEKKVINKFGVHYLLGKDKRGQYVWLEKESWECGWYWGFGYLHTFTNNEHPACSRDIDSHFHFDSTFMKGPEYAKKMFEEYFVETPLTDDEMWILCDYMMTFYTLKKTAELFRHGYSYQTSKAYIDKLKSEEQSDKINHEILPDLFKRIETLLSPAN